MSRDHDICGAKSALSANIGEQCLGHAQQLQDCGAVLCFQPGAARGRLLFPDVHEGGLSKEGTCEVLEPGAYKVN